MQILLQDLEQDNDKIIEISGEEAWLAPIYDSFPAPENCAKPLLKGWLRLRKLDERYVKVKAFVDYRPYVDCSRCSLAISWQVHEHLDLDYIMVANREELQPNKDLKTEDLDACLVFGDVIDLVAVINDCVVLAIPSRTVPASDDGRCQVCFNDTKMALVYASKTVVEDNPFHALKDFSASIKA